MFRRIVKKSMVLFFRVKNLLSVTETSPGNPHALPETNATEHEDTLFIGPVQCTHCHCSWDALAYGRSLFSLECPQCSESESMPVASQPRRSESSR